MTTPRVIPLVPTPVVDTYKQYVFTGTGPDASGLEFVAPSLTPSGLPYEGVLSELKVTIDGIPLESTEYTVSESEGTVSITLDTAPDIGAKVLIYRTTPINTSLVTFPVPTKYSPRDNNKALSQMLLCLQEIWGAFNQSIGNNAALDLQNYADSLEYIRGAVDSLITLALQNDTRLQELEVGLGLRGWTRPDDWLEHPYVFNSAISGLVAVPYTPDESAVVTVTLSATVPGGFTVNWGDGSAAETFDSAEEASHEYKFNLMDPDSYCSGGYRQAMVSVKPTTPGNHFTAIDLVGSEGKPTKWISISMSIPQVTSLDSFTTELFPSLKSLVIPNNAITSGSHMFYNNKVIEYISMYTTLMTSRESMFEGCSNLSNIGGTFDTSSVANLRRTFKGCSNLLNAFRLNCSSCTILEETFSGCSSLTDVVINSATLVTNASGLFDGCHRLDRALVASSLPALVNANNMYRDCWSLTSTALMLTLPAVTSADGMYQNCRSLEYSPNIEFSVLEHCDRLFSGCYTMKSGVLLRFPSASSITNIFEHCHSLASAWLSHLDNTTVLTGLRDLKSLGHLRLDDFSTNLDVSNSNIGATALNQLFDSLPTIETPKTITVTGSTGASTCTPSLARAKGWIVNV